MEPDQAAQSPTAAVLLIGNELLTGKIRDSNGHFLCKVLRRRGIRLVEMTVVEDALDAIGDTFLRLISRADTVFTSGGVGPTHDDLTLEAIARAAGRPLARNAEMEAQLRAHFGERINDAALRMADLPEGTTLCALPGWPVMRLDLTDPPTRIYILPGVPDLLRAKVECLERLPDELPGGSGWHLVRLYTTLDESTLAAELDKIVSEFPSVEIGSYPRWIRGPDGTPRYHVQVTFETAAESAAEADQAREALRALLPPQTVVERDPTPVG